MIATTRSAWAMVAGMTPTLKPGVFVFCTLPRSDRNTSKLEGLAVACFTEAEGISLVLEQDLARRHGFTEAASMAQIVLNVYSDLEGYGLTAAVSTALSEREIACNVVAAFHHDYLFVPLRRAAEAMEILQDLQKRAAAVVLQTGECAVSEAAAS